MQPIETAEVIGAITRGANLNDSSCRDFAAQ